MLLGLRGDCVNPRGDQWAVLWVISECSKSFNFLIGLEGILEEIVQYYILKKGYLIYNNYIQNNL